MRTGEVCFGIGESSELRTIIAGSQSLGWQDLDAALQAHKFAITKVVCGCAPGIDRCGYDYAREADIPVIFFPAWADQYRWAVEHRKVREAIVYPRGGYKGNSRSFGMQRNQAMADYAESLLAIWDGSSPGTRNMRDVAQAGGLVVTVYQPKMNQARLFRV